MQNSDADIRAGADYLNSIRANPSAYSDQIGVDLGYVTARQSLVWNDTLARVATAKAQDMAARNYVAHVDPDGNGMNIKIVQAGYSLQGYLLTDRSANDFESIQAGAMNMTDAINELIADKGTNPPGHRNHLLGIYPFWANCTDIGIGFVKGNASSQLHLLLLHTDSKTRKLKRYAEKINTKSFCHLSGQL